MSPWQRPRQGAEACSETLDLANCDKHPSPLGARLRRHLLGERGLMYSVPSNVSTAPMSSGIVTETSNSWTVSLSTIEAISFPKVENGLVVWDSVTRRELVSRSVIDRDFDDSIINVPPNA